MSSLLQQPRALNRVCAWMLLGFSVLALLWSIVQVALAMTLDHYAVQQIPDDNGLFNQGLLGWALSHATTLSSWQLLSCLPCIAIAAGMLVHHPWARIGFIALLLLSIPLNLGLLILFDQLMLDAGMSLLISGEGALDMTQAMDILLQARVALWLSGGLPTLALCAIHGWLAWRFTHTDMSTLYQR